MRLRIAAGIALSALALVSLHAAPARADGETDERPGGKAGPFMANFKLGPSFGLSKKLPTQLALELDAGYAVLDRSLYLTFSPQLNVVDFAVITFPVGAQYDIRIAKLGPGEIFAYPRFEVGYTRMTYSSGSNKFVMLPEAGAKYLVDGRWTGGLEPLSFGIYIGDKTVTAYRILAYGGAVF